MNLLLRFKNKTVFVALLLAVIAFIYQVLGVFGVVPPVAQESWEQLVLIIANVLVGLGVLVDPTTKGIKDSDQAKEYTTPRANGEVEDITKEV